MAADARGRCKGRGSRRGRRDGRMGGVANRVRVGRCCLLPSAISLLQEETLAEEALGGVGLGRGRGNCHQVLSLGKKWKP